jgi:hypothetical protein
MMRFVVLEQSNNLQPIHQYITAESLFQRGYRGNPNRKWSCDLRSSAIAIIFQCHL